MNIAGSFLILYKKTGEVTSDSAWEWCHFYSSLELYSNLQAHNNDVKIMSENYSKTLLKLLLGGKKKSLIMLLHLSSNNKPRDGNLSRLEFWPDWADPNFLGFGPNVWVLGQTWANKLGPLNWKKLWPFNFIKLWLFSFMEDTRVCACICKRVILGVMHMRKIMVFSFFYVELSNWIVEFCFFNCIRH